jgi:hypothetical protein
MKKLIIIILASLSLTSCSVMKKHKDVFRSKLDSTIVVKKDVEVKQTTTDVAHDTAKVVHTTTTTHDIDSGIVIPSDTAVAQFLAGQTDTLPFLKGGRIVLHKDKNGNTTVTVSTPSKYIPIKLHDTVRVADTTTSISSILSLQVVNSGLKTTDETTITAKDDKSIKTKLKTVFSFPWYVWLVVALAGLGYLAWRNRAAITRLFI